jgi:hypothetical protein
MKMKISKIEKQQSIQKVLELFFKASRPVTELSKNPFLPCFSIHHIFHHSPIKNVGSSQFNSAAESCFWAISKPAHLCLGIHTLCPFHQTFENLA